MNILVVHSNPDVAKLIVMAIESKIPALIHSANDFSAAISLMLDDSNIELVVSSKDQTLEKFYKFILSQPNQVPLILVGEKDGEDPFYFPDLKTLASMPFAKVESDLVNEIKKNFSILQGEESDDEYCRVHTDLLLRVAPLSTDVFIRLSKVKFVRIFRAGTFFTADEYQRYMTRRGITYFYIKKTGTDEFLKKVSIDLDLMLAKEHIDEEEAFSVVNDIHDVTVQMTNKLGFTPEVQEVVKKNMDLALKAIGASRKLNAFLSTSQLKSRNYLSSHSVTLASVACSIAAEMKWTSDKTFEKLVMAALIHDLTLKNPEHSKIRTRQELDAVRDTLPNEDIKLILSHPIRSSDIAKSMKEIPSDVDVIVFQHHEYPDGSGWPKGLNAIHIAPLAAILIVAHDIVAEMDKQKGDENFDLVNFFKNKQDVYNGGFFKKIWTSVWSSAVLNKPKSS